MILFYSIRDSEHQAEIFIVLKNTIIYKSPNIVRYLFKTTIVTKAIIIGRLGGHSFTLECKFIFSVKIQIKPQKLAL